MKTIAAEIRFAEPADAAALAGIHADAWQNAYGGLIPFKALRQMVSRRGADWWRRAIARRAAILVLEFDGRTAGYATLGHNRSQALPVEGEIYEIYLRPEFQGLGFGRRLFEAAGALLKDRGLKGFAVWALAADPRGNLYAATGPTGQLWKRSVDGAWSLLLDSKHAHLLCVAIGPDPGPWHESECEDASIAPALAAYLGVDTPRGAQSLAA